MFLLLCVALAGVTLVLSDLPYLGLQLGLWHSKCLYKHVLDLFWGDWKGCGWLCLSAARIWVFTWWPRMPRLKLKTARLPNSYAQKWHRLSCIVLEKAMHMLQMGRERLESRGSFPCLGSYLTRKRIKGIIQARDKRCIVEMSWHVY